MVSEDVLKATKKLGEKSRIPHTMEEIEDNTHPKPSSEPGSSLLTNTGNLFDQIIYNESPLHV